MIGEGQHFCFANNFGGPGLGIFAIGGGEHFQGLLRQAPGRFIGLAKDIHGQDCHSIIMATREQHIRREKATSNICSNQSFLASLAAANFLYWGSDGLSQSLTTAMNHARSLANKLAQFSQISFPFAKSSFVNEFIIEIDSDQHSADSLRTQGINHGLDIGIDVTSRVKHLRPGKNTTYLKISCSNKHQESDIDKFVEFFETFFQKKSQSETHSFAIAKHHLGQHVPKIPKWQTSDIITYFKKLGQQNMSPDEGIYPLGSCTMKYNPYLHDWAAGLEGFTQTHPQAHPLTVQGNLELLYDIQENFKKITGLAAVTTQPVAGAQGELVGLKLFQAYHADRNEETTRKYIIIPKSAHGTNPATATMAGYTNGIKLVDANADGTINFEQIEKLVDELGPSIAGVMVTNPNTSGIFETSFAKMAKLIHSVGGLVYMDGANMNAIAGWIDLNKLGVDAVHNNLHKTWTIPHGGGGPGDAIVAVSERLKDYLPGMQIIKNEHGVFTPVKAKKSIGSFHRHWGNFAHKIRCYTYLQTLGGYGVRKMSACAVLSARYIYQKLNKTYPVLPQNSLATPRMHEFIVTLSEDLFKKIQNETQLTKPMIMARVGKLFLDFGFHAPTVSFPEPYGLMIEPTESYSQSELDQFAQAVENILSFLQDHPKVLLTVPHFTPIDRVDEVAANKIPTFSAPIPSAPPEVLEDRISPQKIKNMTFADVTHEILQAHEKEFMHIYANKQTSNAINSPSL